jgi:hypothetical protein
MAAAAVGRTRRARPLVAAAPSVHTILYPCVQKEARAWNKYREMSRVGLFVSGLVLCAYTGIERLNALEEHGGGNVTIEPRVFAEQFIAPITRGLPPLVATVLLCKRLL